MSEKNLVLRIQVQSQSPDGALPFIVVESLEIRTASPCLHEDRQLMKPKRPIRSKYSLASLLSPIDQRTTAGPLIP